jgi:hypothetical protein
MYALSMFMQRDIWLFPFPLFRIAFPILMIGMLISDRAKISSKDVLMLLWGVVLLLSSNYVLQLFFSEHYFLTHQSSFQLYSSLMLLLFSLVFLGWQLFIAWNDKSYLRWIQWVGASGFFTCMIVNDFRFAIIGISIWLFGVMRSSAIAKRYQSIALVFWFVVLTVTITGWFAGQDEVLSFL